MQIFTSWPKLEITQTISFDKRHLNGDVYENSSKHPVLRKMFFCQLFVVSMILRRNTCSVCLKQKTKWATKEWDTQSEIAFRIPPKLQTYLLSHWGHAVHGKTPIEVAFHLVIWEPKASRNLRKLINPKLYRETSIKCSLLLLKNMDCSPCLSIIPWLDEMC